MIAADAFGRARSAIAAPRYLSRDVIALALAAVLLLWFNVYTLRPVNTVWQEDLEYSHGDLILIFTVWLCVLELKRKPLAPLAPSLTGLACLCALVLLTVAAAAATTLSVAAAALPALSIATVFAAAGSKNARRFAPRLAYLYVAMPLWAVLIEPMRRLTVWVVMAWIRAAHLPAFIEGNLFRVPSGVFEVQGGCAGLRYAIVAISIAAFCNLLNRRRWLGSAALLLLGVALALVGNWVRVFATVAVGKPELQNPFVVLVRDHHTLFGWVVFGVFMLPLFYADRILQPRSAATPPAPATAAVIGGGSALRSRLAGAYAACAVLACGIWLQHRVDQGDEAAPRTAVLVAPDVAGWQRVGDWQDARRPHYVGTTAQSASWYEDGAARVGAYVAHYGTQRPEHEVVFSANRPQGEFGTVVARRRMVLATDSSASLPFQELEVTDSAAERRLVWVGLRVAGEPAGSALAAKALQIAGAIRGRRDAQAVVLTAACRGDCSSARSALSRYAAAAANPLHERVEAYRSRR